MLELFVKIECERRQDLTAYFTKANTNAVFFTIAFHNHGIFHSIYVFDPNGHRMEPTYEGSTSEEKAAMTTEEIRREMLVEWSRTKRAPVHTQFLHAEELAEARVVAPLAE